MSAVADDRPRVRSSPASRIGGAGLLALVATYGIGRLSYGLFVPRFRAEFGLSLDALGFLASAAQAGYLVAIVLTGVLTARFGPRLPVVAGCLLLAGASALTAAAAGPTMLAIGIVAAGTSAGGTWAPFSDAIGRQVPPAERRRALALVNAGSPVGLVVASLFVLAAGERWRAVWWAFAAVGLLAAAAAWSVLAPRPARPVGVRPRPRWFVNRRSGRLFVVTFLVATTSGAYLAYAPDTAQEAGLGAWIGAAMWAALGLAGGAAGIVAGRLVDRRGLRWPLAFAALLLAVAPPLLLSAPASVAVGLTSAAVFGVGFTLAFAGAAMWSQQVFEDRPTTGFTATIAFAAAGFVVGPSLFGLLATQLGRAAALVGTAVPALLVVFVPPSRADRIAHPDEGSGDRTAS